MPPRERANDRGAHRARHIRAEIGRELREARVGAGLTQREVASATGVSASEISRVESGLRATVSIDRLCRISAVVGLELSVRAYPAATPIRDAASARLGGRFRARIPAGRWLWRLEVPVAGPGDLRAWDATLARPDCTIGVEMETRLRDLQATQRRIELKRRDGTVDRVILVVADTRANRAAIEAGRAMLEAAYPVPPRAALAALAEGRDPGGDALIFI